jgi:TatD DNase family protein
VIDSHTHLFLCEKPTVELLEAAAAAGVERMLNVGLDETTNATVIAQAEANEPVFASVGRHPNSADGFDDAAQAALLELGAHDLVRAIGETGLDFYRDTAAPEAQRRAFVGQIEVAVELGLPIVIHARDADGESAAIDEIFATLDAHAGGHTVILHCFSAPQKVSAANERDWYVSFAGNVTYPRNADLRFAAA